MPTEDTVAARRVRGGILIALLIVLTLGAATESLSGRVVGVTDGDTLTLLVDERQVKVRLAEIDTPENWSTGSRTAQ